MDEATCHQLLTAHEGAPVSTLPAGFVYDRRLVAVLCGVVFLRMARRGGYTLATGTAFDSAPSLAEFYRQMTSGSVNVGTPEGQWAFGLALTNESFAF
jgi:hypothetical protein